MVDDDDDDDDDIPDIYQGLVKLSEEKIWK